MSELPAFRLLALEDGSHWADPNEVREALWRIRHGHGEPSNADHEHVHTAAMCYLALVDRPEFRKKLPMIRRALLNEGDAP